MGLQVYDAPIRPKRPSYLHALLSIQSSDRCHCRGRCKRFYERPTLAARQQPADWFNCSSSIQGHQPKHDSRQRCFLWPGLAAGHWRGSVLDTPFAMYFEERRRIKGLKTVICIIVWLSFLCFCFCFSMLGLCTHSHGFRLIRSFCLCPVMVLLCFQCCKVDR